MREEVRCEGKAALQWPFSLHCNRYLTKDRRLSSEYVQCYYNGINNLFGESLLTADTAKLGHNTLEPDVPYERRLT